MCCPLARSEHLTISHHARYLTPDGLTALENDFKLICENCYEFNGDEGNAYSDQARVMQQKSTGLFAEAHEQWTAVLATNDVVSLR